MHASNELGRERYSKSHVAQQHRRVRLELWQERRHEAQLVSIERRKRGRRRVYYAAHALRRFDGGSGCDVCGRILLIGVCGCWRRLLRRGTFTVAIHPRVHLRALRLRLNGVVRGASGGR